MPRTRSSKSRAHAGKKPRPINKAHGKINKWNKVSDIPLDEEDQFHASRDKILLDGETYNGSDDEDDDEVFALKDLEDEEMEADEDEDEEDEFEEQPQSPKIVARSKSKRKAETSASEESESEEETWGKSKAAYYSSNAAQLESDDEEGHELEEQEAIKLQAKSREDWAIDDFGLNDIPNIEDRDDGDAIEPPQAILPVLPTDKKSLIRHLEKTSPEALALARDWDSTAHDLMKTKERLERIHLDDPDALSLGMIHLYYQALLSYATTLAFYLHLRASEKYAQRPESLNSHPILQRLLTLKQSLQTLEDLDFAVGSDSDEEDYEDDEDGNHAAVKRGGMLGDAETVWGLGEMDGLDEDELSELLKDALSPQTSLGKTPSRARAGKLNKKLKTSKSTPAVIFDLEEPEFVSSKATSNRLPLSSIDAFGEATSLPQVDAADKSARKKSLRFHTSKIEGVSARRQGARTRAAGGDDDLPYRERKKVKDARLAEEAKNRVKNQGGADLGDSEAPDHTTAKRKREEESETEDADGYYELVKRQLAENKEKKRAEYENSQAATRPHTEMGDLSGPRSLTRAIMANKGLTPHRPKSVRNPRVKKRQKFEKAKKKISSQKAIYKGGISNTGRYDGEKSGISKVVKSVRLG